jgi:hypothetical protein
LVLANERFTDDRKGLRSRIILPSFRQVIDLQVTPGDIIWNFRPCGYKVSWRLVRVEMHKVLNHG